MAKKLPEHVYPCGVEYTVTLEHMDCDDYGETEGDLRVIRINTNPKRGEHFRTLFHEYIHAVFYSTGLAQVIKSRGGDLEEAIVIAIEEHVFRMIDTNKLGDKP